MYLSCRVRVTLREPIVADELDGEHNLKMQPGEGEMLDVEQVGQFLFLHSLLSNIRERVSI